MTRLSVRKTYKLYVGGAFVRSESGRYDRALDADDEHVANVPRASRKDVRDAMAAARKAAGPWAARTAYNRGQILYRAAEALESRGDALAPAVELAAAVGSNLLYVFCQMTPAFRALATSKAFEPLSVQMPAARP